MSKLTTLDAFACYFTGGSLEGYPSGQKVVFYGNFAPEELSLEEFAEQFEKFVLQRNK